MNKTLTIKKYENGQIKTMQIHQPICDIDKTDNGRYLRTFNKNVLSKFYDDPLLQVNRLFKTIVFKTQKDAISDTVNALKKYQTGI